MTSDEIRFKYLNFFKERGHTVIPSASLVPGETDSTVLFTTAGMHPLVPFLLGEKHPSGNNRLTSVQKCIRTADIDEVGDTRHLTFFEMLGNWSLGDYFKEEAIDMSWEFLTGKEGLGLDKNKLAVSVFEGDEDAPFDEEAFGLWQKHGVPEERIAKLPKKDNWWGPAGETGPCGPDTEMFYWVKSEPAPKKFDPENDGWMEIWNDVFMEYDKKKDGTYEFLKQKNVDTGMGLERVAMIMQGKKNVYETDVFEPLVARIKNYELGIKNEEKSIRIIADHVKAATFIISDGVVPSNTGQGYVLRRLIRRAIRHAKLIGIEKSFTGDIAQTVVDIYGKSYPEVLTNKNKIFEELQKEEEKFNVTLEKGLKEFSKISENNISGKDAFNLYQTYGFPVEMIKELAEEKGKKVNTESFCAELQKHQELSRTASAGMFKGGLADSTEKTTKLHTATHLLLASLRQVLGKHVEQRGSNITEKRLRLDFSHPEKLTDEERKKVEDLVNQKIKENLPVLLEEMTLDEARKAGAVGIFESKYGDRVKVYSTGNSSTGSEPPFSREICGGPHVEKTGILGRFEIIKEEASSAGIRRIKAVVV